MPPKLINVSPNTAAKTLQNLFNECLIADNFPDDLKLAYITELLRRKIFSIKKTTNQSVLVYGKSCSEGLPKDLSYLQSYETLQMIPRFFACDKDLNSLLN